MTRRVWWRVLWVALLPAACSPDTPTDATRVRATAALAVRAHVVSAAATSIRILAQTDVDTDLLLAQQTIALGAASGQQVPVRIDLTDCLARLSPAEPCPVRIRAELRDGAGTVLDQVLSLPIGLRPFQTAALPDVIELREVRRITISPAPLVLTLGATQTLVATVLDVTDAVVAGRTVTWSTGNATIATVSSAGVVTAVGLGTGVIIAAAGARTASINVTVTPPPSIALSNPGPVQLAAVSGQSAVVTATNTVQNAGGGTLSGLSSTVSYIGTPPTPWLAATLSATTAPATLTLQVNASQLPAGSYAADVTVQSTLAGVAPRALRVNLTVAPPPSIALSNTAPIQLTAVAGQSALVTTSLTAQNGGGGTLSGLSATVAYIGTPPAPWLTATLSSTTAPATLTLQVNAAQLTAGTYVADVTVQSTLSGVAPRTLRVTVTVTPPPVITLSNPGPVQLAAVAGQSTPVSANLAVQNSGGGTLSGLSATVTYVGTPPTPWLTATLSATTAPATLTLQVNASQLPSGSYAADVTVRSTLAGVAPRTLRVNVTVSLPPVIALSNPGPVQLSAVAGQSSLVADTLTVQNAGGGTLSGLSASVTYIGSPPAAWLTATFAVTTAPATLTLLLNASQLPAGTYDADVTVQSTLAGVAPRTLRVRANISAAPPVISIEVDTIHVSWQPGTPIAAPQAVPVQNIGGGTLTGLTISTVYFSRQGGWLLSSIGTTAPTALTVSVSPFNLTFGTYAARVDVSSTAAGVTQRSLAVILHVVSFPTFDCAITTTPAYFPPAAARRVSLVAPFVSGGSGSWELAFNLGVKPQPIRVEWNAFSEQDAFNVCFRGLNVFDTGDPVLGSGAFTFPYRGSPGTDGKDPSQSIYLWVVVRAPLSQTVWSTRVVGDYIPPQYPVPPDSIIFTRVSPGPRLRVTP